MLLCETGGQAPFYRKLVFCSICIGFIVMIEGENTYRNVHGFTECELQRMRDYLLGAVHAWCRDRHGEWFAARDLLGGANYFWQGTPLNRLYEYYMEQSDEDSEYSITQAGRSAGNLLKRVLIEDTKRTYETRSGYTREYRWVGEENL